MERGKPLHSPLLGGVEHVQHEANTLADRNEADHDREDHRQQSDDLIQYAVEHPCSDNAAERSGSSSGFLKQYLLLRFGLSPWLRALESNQQLQVQSLKCYLYTSPLYV